MSKTQTRPLPLNDKTDLLSTSQAARQLGLRRHQLSYRLENGTFPDIAARIGGKRAFSPQLIEHYREILAK